MSLRRWLRFHAVGLGGIVVQTGALAALTPVLAPLYLAATALAVEAAVLHNFLWHTRWTWGDRPGSILARLARFHLANGLFSIAGNLILMRLLVGEAGLHPVVANLIAIALCSLANYLASDRFVFPAPGLR